MALMALIELRKAAIQAFTRLELTNTQSVDYLKRQMRYAQDALAGEMPLLRAAIARSRKDDAR
jgi:hypothetical protein